MHYFNLISHQERSMGLSVSKANHHARCKVLTRAGIDHFRWHNLQHIRAHWHVFHGTPLDVLQELNGRSSYSMVRTMPICRSGI